MIINKEKENKIFFSKGFTFPEIMIALCILAVAVTGSIALFTHCMLLTQRARNISIATAHAEYTLEEIGKTALTTITDRANSGWWTAWAQGQGLNTLSQEAVNVSAAGTDPLSVTVTVSWAERTGTESLSFATKVTE